MELKDTINETPIGYENGKREAASGLGRGLDTLLNGRDKRTSFGLGKGLDVLIGEKNKHTFSSDKE